MESKIDARAGQSLAKMTIAIGAISELHSHSNCTETLHVLNGEIAQRIDNKWMNMQAGDTCLIPVGSAHQTRNIGAAEAVVMLAYSAGRREYAKL